MTTGSARPNADNMVLGFRRHTSSFAFAPGEVGAWDPDYPLSNLKNDDLEWVARAEANADGTVSLVGTSAVPLPIGMFTFVDHNGDPGAQYRVELFGSTSLTPDWLLYDSDWREFSGYAFRPSSVAYGDPRLWGGRYTKKDLQGRTNVEAVWLDGETHLVQGVRVNIRYQTSEPFEMAVLDLAEGWQLKVNFAKGAGRQLLSRTRVRQARGGKERYGREAQAVAWSGTVDFMERDEARTRAWEMFVAHDKDVPLVVIPMPSAEDQAREALFVRNSDIDGIVHQSGDRDKVSFKFKSAI